MFQNFDSKTAIGGFVGALAGAGLASMYGKKYKISPAVGAALGAAVAGGGTYVYGQMGGSQPTTTASTAGDGVNGLDPVITGGGAVLGAMAGAAVGQPLLGAAIGAGAGAGIGYSQS